MASKTLQGKKVAILATHGFEQVELQEPGKVLDKARATSRKRNDIPSFNREIRMVSEASGESRLAENGLIAS